MFDKSSAFFIFDIAVFLVRSPMICIKWMEEIPRRKAYTQSTVHSKSAMAIRASAIKLQACDSVEIVIVPEIYY